ncbi:NB-ARC domain-containing protein [Microcoleus sp. FACHB-68]|uniref:NB-ARC domain-containing protein n=1 Tax=Microcoleus sp. FACHB-68 TaxID=2692826 RepID=UPI0016897844|nr:NB-ARC domain-containing protein [Microcoleus sp. FACHB-68]MBD1937768.1 NACHT domain-containing protein [Microcoleus sp. FACHB-68]
MAGNLRAAVLSASQKKLEIIDEARKKKGWKKTSIAWCQAAHTTEATLKRFWRSIPIRQDSFINICQAVGLNNWKEIADALPQIEAHTDWGEAPDVTAFYGRAGELTTLKKWVVEENCRLIGILGMGGIGKTAVSVKLAKEVQDNFDYIIWRSLHQAPPLNELLTDLLEFLSYQPAPDLTGDASELISRLIECLRRYRCLLVLDNLEAILSSGDFVGHYQAGYKVYGELLKRVGETPHQSCLVLTSREKLREVALLEGETLPVRSYQLAGLGDEAREIFKEKGLVQEDKWGTLINIYRGNPFMLKIVSAFIKEVFDGKVSEFLKIGTTQVTRDISDFIEVHFERLSKLEMQIVYQLSLEKEPVALSELQESLSGVSSIELTNALASLVGRSLIEKSSGRFTLQPVVQEYVTSLELKYSE